MSTLARELRQRGKLTRHASHRRRPSSPTRHSLSSFREHSRHLRHFGWYLLPRGPRTVSFSVARTEQPAQIKSPPRPAGGRGRREKRDGSTALVGDEEGMLYFGGRLVELGRSRIEREVGSAEGESGAAASGRAGLGEDVGRAHCGGVQGQQIRPNTYRRNRTPAGGKASPLDPRTLSRRRREVDCSQHSRSTSHGSCDRSEAQ